MRVALFIPCFVDQFYPQVGRATVALLERLGVEVSYDPRQTCCGQPAFNSGYWDEARRVAEHFVSVFRSHESIVAPSGSCVSMVRHHVARLIDDREGVCPRVYELCEFLVQRLHVTETGAALTGRAALHVPCHLMRELRGAEAVRTLMRGVRGLELIDLPSDEWCCGFGGTFSIKFPELSAAMGLRKLRDAAAAGVEYVISPESSCLMQLEGLMRRAGTSARPLHVAEVLAGMV